MSDIVTVDPTATMVHSVRSSLSGPYKYWTSDGYRKGRLHNNGDPITRKLRVACAGCNGGWMSILQERAKSILAPLIRGETRDIDESDQIIIADWMTMSAMVAEFALPEGVLLNAEERLRFSKNFDKPVLTRAWIGISAAVSWNKRCQTSHAGYMRGPVSSEKPCRLVIHTASIGKLCTHIIFWDEMNERMDFEEYEQAFGIEPVDVGRGNIRLSRILGDRDLTVLATIVRDILLDSSES